MAGTFMNKVWNLLGVETNEDQEIIQEEEAPKQKGELGDFLRKNSGNKLVSMPQVSNVPKVVIVQPSAFEEAEVICSHLKNKKSVIINLEYVNKDVARRIVDFLSGAVYGIDGEFDRVSASIFLATPQNYEVTNEIAQEETKNKLTFSWLNNKTGIN